MSASASAIRARAEGTGTPAYEGHQVINVPKLRAPAFMATLLCRALKTLDCWPVCNTVRAKWPPLRNGDRAQLHGVQYRRSLFDADQWPYAVFRLAVDNVFDKRYWRDVGESAGDGYLFPGAPLTARLSAQLAF